MDLMIDIGNTHTVLGVYNKDRLEKHWRLTSHGSRTEDEIWTVVDSFFNLGNLHTSQIKGVCISSVVPGVTRIYQWMTEKYLGCQPMQIGPDLDLGLKIHYHDPYAVGADRICNAVAGKKRYGTPLIILDFGTATTFDCVNEQGDYLGGVICPGLESTASILHHQAAKLPKIELVFPPKVIGLNTEESMQSGIMYGSIEMIDGMVNRIKGELKGNPKVIATGGLASLIAERSKAIDIVDENLNLEGIYLLYKRNLSKNGS
jgi:type III pantothenate kinase